jgi:hypothetical protein
MDSFERRNEGRYIQESREIVDMDMRGTLRGGWDEMEEALIS